MCDIFFMEKYNTYLWNSSHMLEKYVLYSCWYNILYVAIK